VSLNYLFCYLFVYTRIDQARSKLTFIGVFSAPLLFPPFPSFPFPSHPIPSFQFHVSCPIPYFPLLSFSLPLPLKIGPLLRLEGLGGAQATSAGPPKRFLVNCRLKIAPVGCSSSGLEEVYKTYQYMIDLKNAIRYLVRQSQHTIYCVIWDTKISVLLWSERRQRRVKDTHSLLRLTS